MILEYDIDNVLQQLDDLNIVIVNDFKCIDNAKMNILKFYKYYFDIL